MGLETVYNVRTKYTADVSQAQSGLAGLAHQADRTGHSVGGLKSILLGLGGIGVLHEMKKSFIDFNAEIEQTKISLATIIEGNLGGSMEHATRDANALFLEFQRFSKLTPVTTQEMTEFGTAVSAAVFGAGGSIKDFTNIAEQGVIASKVFGRGAAYSQIEMSEMLAGVVTSRNMFARNLLAFTPHHMDRKEFNALSGEGRIKAIEEALNSPGMKAGLDKFTHSFAGVTSTFKDNMQIALGGAGAGLFKEITAEIGKWNQWFERHPRELARYTKQVSDALISGFHAVKTAVAFLVDHADTLKLIAEFAVAGKGISMLGGGFGGLMGLFSGVTGVGNAAAGATPKLFGAIAGLASLGVGLAAIRLGAEAAAAALDAYQTKNLADDTAASQFDSVAGVGRSEGPWTDDLLKDLKSGAFFTDPANALIGRGESLATPEMAALWGARARRKPMGQSDATRLLLDARDQHMVHSDFLGGRAMLDQKAVDAFAASHGRSKEWAQIVGTKLSEALGAVDKAQLAGTFGRILADAFGHPGTLAAIFNGSSNGGDLLAGASAAALKLLSDSDRKGLRDPNINMTVNIKEVKSEDPDRFVHMLTDVARRHLKTPVQTRRALRQG